MRFNNYDVVDQSYVSASLKKFYFLGLLVHDFLTRGIGSYMPELVELEVYRACKDCFRDILSLNIF